MRYTVAMYLRLSFADEGDNDEIKSGNIQCLIVKDLSRFSRDYIELGSYMNQIFPFLGVRFLAINDQYDSESHKGSTVELDTAFKTLVYDLYSKDLSEKVKTVIQNKYENGENPSGTLALGYERINHEIVIQEQEAEIVRYIFQLSVEGYSTVQIAKILYEKGIPTTRCFGGIDSTNVKSAAFSAWRLNEIKGILSRYT